MPLNTIPNKGLTSRGYPSDRLVTPIIINGDMSVAQRATSATGITSTSYNTCDRWEIVISSLGTWTQSQSTDVPTGQGFSSSFKIECTTANASPAAGAFLMIQQNIEGQNLQMLKFGTSNAEGLTASFWVKSNKTGTYVCELWNRDANRIYNQAYTISSANTWEKKTLTWEGDTGGSGINNDNGTGMEMSFFLGAGSDRTSGTLPTGWETRDNANRAVGQVNLADSTSNEFYVTGVQLEVGEFDSTTIPSFPFESYDSNLKKCQRYFYQHVPKGYSITIGTGHYYNSSDIRCTYQFPTTMRANPSLIQETGTNAFYFERNNGNDQFNSWTALVRQNVNTATTYVTGRSGTAGQAGICYVDQNLGSISFDAEL